MANDLIPLPKRPGANGNGHSNGRPLYTPPANQVYDPLVPAEYVDTDPQTAGVEWDLPPLPVSPRMRSQDRREASRHAQHVETEAGEARARGEESLAAVRVSDAAEIRQGLMDWGDLKTWGAIFAMFLGFLLFVAFVYFMPQGRHNQNDGPMPVPSIRVY